MSEYGKLGKRQRAYMEDCTALIAKAVALEIPLAPRTQHYGVWGRRDLPNCQYFSHAYYVLGVHGPLCVSQTVHQSVS